MKPSTIKVQSLFLLIFVNIMWGLSFIFSKTALSEGMPAMTLAFLRYAMTAAILVPVCLYREGGLRLGRHAPRALLTALLGIAVYYHFEYSGLQRTTASAASLILALVPMMTLLYRAVIRREHLSLPRWGCVMLSLLGVYLILRADFGLGGTSLSGNLFMIAACLCWTGYILLTPPLMRACNALRVTTWQSLAAVVTLAPFALAEHRSWTPISARSWLCIFLLAAICSALCYLLYGMAIRHVDSLTVSLTININPIAACVAGALLLHESLSGAQLAGGALILLCVLADSLWQNVSSTPKNQA